MNTADIKILEQAKANEHLLPTPEYIDHLIVNDSLSMLDIVINRGVAGLMFHNYQMQFLNKLHDHGIDTFVQLKQEYDKIQSKSSKLSRVIRDIVQGHFNYYKSEIKKIKDLYDITSNKVVEGNHWYINETDAEVTA